MTEQRYDWIDQLKGIAMCFIVFGHVTHSSNVPHVVFCYAFHIPLFFMISGMTEYIHLSRHPEKESIPHVIWKKIKQLVIPYFLLNLFFIPEYYLNYSVLRHTGNTSILSLLKGILYSNSDKYGAPTNATWFLLTLFLAEILFDLLKRMFKNNPDKLLLAGMFLAMVGYGESISGIRLHYPWHFQAVPMAVFFLSVGFWFMANKDRVVKTFEGIFKNKFLRALFLLVVFAAGTVLALKNGKVSIPGSQYKSIVLYFAACFCICAVLIYLAMWIRPLWIFKFIGRNTIFYMAAHCIIMRTMMVVPLLDSWVDKYPAVIAIMLIVILIPLSMLINLCLPFLVGKKYRRRKKAA